MSLYESTPSISTGFSAIEIWQQCLDANAYANASNGPYPLLPPFGHARAKLAANVTQGSTKEIVDFGSSATILHRE